VEGLLVEAEKTSHSCDHLPGEDHGHWAHCTLDLACTEVPHAPIDCCSLLVEHSGGQEEEEEEVVGDMKEVVPVDDTAWWSITLLVHPSTLGSAAVAGGATTMALQCGQQQIVMN